MDPSFTEKFSEVKPLHAKGSTPKTWRQQLTDWLAIVRARDLVSKGLAKRVDRSLLQKATGVDFLSDEVDIENGGYTRCVTSTYAMQTYFCGAGAASRFWQLGLNDGADSLGEYLDTVRAWAAENAVPVPQAVIEVHVIDDSDKDVGHVFVLHALPDGRVQLYQSFISQYSLQAHLQSTKPFDQAAMSKFVDQLRTLEKASYGNWMLHADAAYRSAFNYKGDAFAYKHAAGQISVTWSVTCIVPPWNGTHADV